MTPKRRPVPTDQQVDEWIGAMLQAGVLAAWTVVFVGGILYLLRYGGNAPHYGLFQRQADALPPLRELAAGLLHLDGRAVIELGVLILVATPVARVILSIFAFAVERDRVYVVVTCVVLAILLYSLLGGGPG